MDVIILGILAALLVPCKIVYSGIFALCIFIPKKKYSKKIYYFSTLAVIVFMILLSNVYVNFGMIRAMSGTTATAVESTSASAPEQYSLMWCLQHPLGTFLIYYRTALTYGKYYFETMFGGLLGWLEIKVSNWLVHLFALITFLSAFSQSKSTDKIKKGHRIISVMIMFCVYCLVLASMFFGCTPYGVPIILGVQGRYFLAILPLLAILVGNKKWKLSQKWDSCMCLLLIVLNFVTLCQVFSTICVR